jgi:secreted PhoX family phosphatase
MLAFRGGEGAWFSQGELSFTTKGDDRVWCYVPASNALSVLYDGQADEAAPLRGVDNLIQDASGLRYVAEDGGDMQVCIVDATGRASVLAQLTGVRGSEITGLAFTPAGDRLYFSSQRRPGATYEIRGPFAALRAG